MIKDQLINSKTVKLANDYGVDIGDGVRNYETLTQSLLQKWFREVHDVYVSINTSSTIQTYGSVDDGDWDYLPTHKSRIIKNIDDFKYDVIDDSDEFNTYERSLEDGLQRAFTLITKSIQK